MAPSISSLTRLPQPSTAGSVTMGRRSPASGSRTRSPWQRPSEKGSRSSPMRGLQLMEGVMAAGAILAARWGAGGGVNIAAGASPAHHRIEGFWQGTLDTGAIPLRLVFRIEKKLDGSMTGTLDSIDQGAKGIPLSAVSLKDDTVRVEVKVISGVYQGKLSAEGRQITGEWEQGPAKLPLTLKRVEKVAELRRPQEPKKPYPYIAEEVAYANKEDGNRLAGTLTRPRIGGPFPAAL